MGEKARDSADCVIRAHFNMIPIAQSPTNQAPMASQLIDVLRQGRLRMYASRELRDAAAKTVVHESSRGFRLGKAKHSDKVDPIIAIAMAVLMAGREESVGGCYEVYNFYTGEPMVRNAGGIDDETGLPILRQRAPDFKPMARPEVEADPDAPVHPGATLWDFIDARGLDKDDPAVDQAYAWALADYRKALAEYRQRKSGATIESDRVDLARS
jgi:hypothetical protein